VLAAEKSFMLWEHCWNFNEVGMSSHYLDVAVGLSYTFLAVSLLCSATREAIASLFQTRAKVLLDGVLTMLHESAASRAARRVAVAAAAVPARGRLRAGQAG
jgi:hypothetical protein